MKTKNREWLIVRTGWSRRQAWLLAMCVGIGMMALAAALVGVKAAERSDDGIWERAEQATQWLREQGRIPARASVFRLNEAILARVFAGIDGTTEKERKKKSAAMTLPMPEGSFERVRLEEVQVMEPALEARFPEIRNYRGASVERGAWSVRVTHSPQGLSAFVTDGVETISIQPINVDGSQYYVSACGKDYESLAGAARCLVGETEMRELARQNHRRGWRAFAPPVGATLRTYRMAIATTEQYSSAFGGSVVNVLASLNIWVNQVSGIYEKELSVKFTLAQNNVNVIYTGTSPFTNLTLAQMADKSREVLQQSIGLGNYDLGLVFGTGATSGLSSIGVVCENGGDGTFAYKGGGAVLFSTGCEAGCAAGNPTGTGMLAHEVGHLFGATHTFNESVCSSAGRVAETAYEPGSGLTIMSNAGTCAGHDIAAARALHFHSGSFEQITAFINENFGGCAVATAMTNNPPAVNGGADYVIPKQTPFALTATGSDADAGDVPNLIYVWEEMDAGGAFPNPHYADQASDPPGTTRPLFRPFAPAANGASRTFPSLTYIKDNANVPPPMVGGLQTAENLPAVHRQLNFNVTVRDQRGGVGNDSVSLDVAGNAGPFLVTSPASSATWAGGTQQTVTWSVNGTNAAPVNCANVKISLSIDGGNTFPQVLAASVSNNGGATITIPLGLNSTTARVKVEALGNIFFDISDVNFTVTPGCGYSINPTNQHFLFGGGSNSVAVTVAAGCSWTAASNATWITITSGANGAGNGTVNYSIGANTGLGRAGTMTIAGQTFTVTQDAGPNSGLQFYPLPAPVRLLDTRPGEGNCDTASEPMSANATFVLPARTTCAGIPANANAITGHITVVPSEPGFLTIFPSDAGQPSVANSNFTAGEVTNNVFTVGLGAADGAFKIFSNASTHVIVDVTGYYAPPGAGGLYFHPLPNPVRLLETRAGFTGCIAPGTPLTGTGDANADPNLDLGVQGRSPIAPPCNSIPASAKVLVGNATSVLPSGGGYLTIYPSGGARPSVASSNYAGSDVINGPFAVKLGSDGKFKVYTFATTHLVIDILGYYSEDANDVNGAGMFFNPLPSPVRLLETRPDFPGFPLTGCTRTNAKIQGDQAMATHTQSAGNFCGLPATAQAVVGNVTVVNSMGAGYLTLFPANLTTAPSVATSNYPTPATFGYNRHYFVGLSPTDGKFKVLTQFTTDLVLDASGYFAP